MKPSKFMSRTLAATAVAALAIGAQPAFAKKDTNEDNEPQVEAQAESDTGDRPFNPLGGRIRAFEGDVDSLGGRIRAFESDLEPFVGRIRAFEGDVDSMGGRIRAFEDDIDPLKGNIRAFWGDLTPNQGELDPKVGRIRAFSDEFISQASSVLAAWSAGDAAGLEAELQALIADGKVQWSDEIEEQTGKSFEEAFADEFFEKWGVNLSNIDEISGWNAFQRQSFLLDWYDNLLNFSGMDQIDHWMNAVNWTPAITQVQGGGASTTIGVLDFFAAPDSDVASKTVYAGGYQNVNDAHGAGVSSLLVASHDGRGVMGIAPQATIAGFNPFDETLTASWDDVKAGIIAVGEADASVVNLSLGVSGYTLPSDWVDIFDDKAVEKFRDNTVYVIAAGNDGIAQTQDVEFYGALDTTFILVGSVDPNGQISEFSNRPGEACLLEKGKCGDAKGNFYKKSEYLSKSGLLMNRFLVAPGEMILVSDGEGGVTRMSGTSFAAPLVTGAIALIHDRWPWLKEYPKDVAKAILESAQDLGEPGVDPVYGWGLLDIEASQAALDFDDLDFYTVENGKMSKKSDKAKKIQKAGFQSSWAADDAYFVAFEDLVKSDRDFLIPLSDRLFNTSVNGQTMQEFMYHRFVSWIGGQDGIASTSFSDMNTTPAIPMANGWSFAVSGQQNVVAGNQFLLRPQLETTFHLNAPGNRFGFAFGHGDASALIGGQRNLGLASDYNPVTGGANPLLGFAAGGTHVSARAQLADGLDMSVSVSQRDGSVQERIAREDFAVTERFLLDERGDYRANAMTFRLDYRASAASTFSLALTSLDENDALFGVRSLEPTDFGSGVRTNGVTLAADFDLGKGLSVFGSATGSNSGSANDAALQVRDAFSSAFQVGMAKRGVVGANDSLRITVAQPLTLERGFIDAEMVAVVDRRTGEKGIVTERFDITPSTERRFVAEGYYAAPVMKGTAEFSLFARAELRPQANFDEQTADFLSGVKFRLAF